MAVVFMILQVVVFFGAFKMLKLESYKLAMAASIISVIPCVGLLYHWDSVWHLGLGGLERSGRQSSFPEQK